MTPPTPIRDNPAYKLAYQLDEMRVTSYTVQTEPLAGLHATFVFVEHGYAGYPMQPLVLSMQ